MSVKEGDTLAVMRDCTHTYQQFCQQDEHPRERFKIVWIEKDFTNGDYIIVRLQPVKDG